MSRAIGITALFLALAFAAPASAEQFRPLNDTISARLLMSAQAIDIDQGWQRERGKGLLGGVRLQFGATGKTFGLVLAWEPVFGKLWTSANPEGGFNGRSPFEILLNAWLPVGQSQLCLRGGVWVDYLGGPFSDSVYWMLRSRFDWGAGAVEVSGAYSVIQFATVGYRHRLSTNWVLVGDLKAYRIPTVLSPTTVDAVGVSHTVERTVTGHAFQGLVAIEWALDGE